MTDLRTLKDFVVLARERSFSQAAMHCNVTTSGLSRRISALEEWLGVSLFDRGRHQLVLTVAGEEFHAAAVDVVARLDKARRSVLRTQDKYQKQISIAAPHVMSRAFFLTWLPKVNRYSEGSSFSLNFATLDMCFNQLVSMEADFVIAFSDVNKGIEERLAQMCDLQDVERLKIGAQLMVPVTAPNLLGEPLINLAGNRSEVACLYYQPECSLGWAHEKKLKADMRLSALRKVHDCSLADGLLSMALVGLGVAWLPLELVRAELEKGALIRAGGSDFDIELEVFIYRHNQRPGTRAALLWDSLRELKAS